VCHVARFYWKNRTQFLTTLLMKTAVVSAIYIHRSLARSVLFLISLLIVIVAVLVAAQEASSAAGPQLQPDGGEEAAVKRVVDSIIQPYLAQCLHPIGTPMPESGY
jgi:hypothetical protein